MIKGDNAHPREIRLRSERPRGDERGSWTSVLINTWVYVSIFNVSFHTA